MPEFKVGDKVEILFHMNADYKGKQGKIGYIGSGLMQGTNPLDYNIELPEQEARFVVLMEDGAVLSDVRPGQLRKV
jgi:hypothetical protein